MRHRERHSIERRGTIVTTDQCAAALPPLTTDMSAVYESFDDVVTPNFRERLRRGEVIFNDCFKERVVIDKTGGGSYTSWRMPNNTCVVTGTGDGSITTWFQRDGAISNLADNVDVSCDIAKQAAISGLDRTPYSFAEDLLELKQTLGFLENGTLTRLAKLSQDYFVRKKVGLALLKARRASALDVMKFLSNLYLEFRFGFRPLVQSAYNLMQSFSDTSRIKVDNRFSHGREPVKSYSHSDTVANLSFTFNRSVSSNCESYATIAYRLTNPVDDWRYIYGLRNKDLLVGLWETFPLSFMVDRVLDIRGCIRGLTNLADPNVVILGACTSKKISRAQFISGFLQHTWPVNQQIIIPDTDSVYTESYTRVGWSPTVLDTLPSFTPKNLVKDISSCADLLTLVVQRLK